MEISEKFLRRLYEASHTSEGKICVNTDEQLIEFAREVLRLLNLTIFDMMCNLAKTEVKT